MMNDLSTNSNRMDVSYYLFTREILVGNYNNKPALSHFKEKTKEEYNQYLIKNNININNITDIIYDIIKIPYKFNELYGNLYSKNNGLLNEFNKTVLKIFCIENDKEEELDNDMNDIENMLEQL
jgi:hypothetical protein